MPRVTGLIDAFTEGYQAVNRHLWVLLIPILLNGFFWFGPPVSVAPIITQVLSFSERINPNQSIEAQEQLMDLMGILSNSDIRQNLALLNYVPLTMYAFRPVGANADALGLSFVQSISPPIQPGQQDVIYVADGWLLVVIAIAINMLTLPLSAAFLSLLAQAVCNEPRSFGAWVRAFGWALLRLSAYIGIIFAVAIAFGMPVLVLVTLLAAVSPAVSSVLFLFASALWTWVGIYIGFAREAIAVAELGPLRAFYASFQVVRRHFWSTLGLLAITTLVAVGCGVIWLQVAGTPFGKGLAIIGSAYIGVGLVAARMVFFRERARQLVLPGLAQQPTIGRT